MGISNIRESHYNHNFGSNFGPNFGFPDPNFGFNQMNQNKNDGIYSQSYSQNRNQVNFLAHIKEGSLRLNFQSSCQTFLKLTKKDGDYFLGDSRNCIFNMKGSINS